MSDTEAGPDEGVPEERFEFNEGPKHDLSEMEIPSQDREQVTATFALEVRRSVRKTHRGLGHPPFKTGSSDCCGSVEHRRQHRAKHWRCPTCLAASLSRRLVKTTTRLRPFLSTKMVCLELK